MDKAEQQRRKQELIEIVKKLRNRTSYHSGEIVDKMNLFLAQNGTKRNGTVTKILYTDRFTARPDRLFNDTVDYLPALIWTFTADLESYKRCTAEEAVRLAQLMPVLVENLLPKLQPFFTPEEWDRALKGIQQKAPLEQEVSIEVPRKDISRKHIIMVIVLVMVLAFFVVMLSWPQLHPSTQKGTLTLTSNSQWVPTQTTVVSDQVTFDMVYVPARCFNMGYNYGDPNEAPAHQVCLDAFWIGKTEITNGQFGAPPDSECNQNQADPTRPPVNGTEPDYPHNCTTWQEAYDFCFAHDMRLPTEAEWEWAARGPSEYLYPWGNNFDSSRAVVRTNPNDASEPGKMLPAGSHPEGASWVGALDMAGSLREFTSTIYGDYTYPYDPNDGRENPENEGSSAEGNATTRVLRGGSFDHYGGDFNRVTRRIDEWYDFRFNTYGFRCVKDVD